MSYNVIDESLISIVPDVLVGYMRSAVTAVSPVTMIIVGIVVFIFVASAFLNRG